MSFPTWLKALVAQSAAVFIAALALGLASLWAVPVPPIALLALQSLCAVGLGLRLGLPMWWAPILALFVPALLLGLNQHWPPGWFLAAFVLCWLVFRGAAGERVPLYLSNAATCQALADLLPGEGGFAFLDLGSGLGGTLARLARQRPEGRFYGVESALGSWLYSWLRLRGLRNARVRWDTLWREDLGACDVAYAFLSPSPMPRLWEKVQAEMRPGALFISNSFEVPGATPDEVRVLDDARRTRLLIWRIKPSSSPAP
jgi:hypothetical protein